MFRLGRAILTLAFSSVGLFGQSFSYPGFSSTAGLTINGSAATFRTSDGTVLRLTPALDSQAGSVFSTTSINFQSASDAFSTFFQFRITNPSYPPADGLVFVIQPQADNSVGNTGSGLGYLGISHSLGIEFDSYQNNEPDDNHVAILRDGNVNEGADDFSSANPYGVTNCASPTGVFGCLANGDLWSVWIDYDGTSLHVALADNSTTRPADLITYPVGIPGILSSTTDFVGFTAATGTFYENHDIVNWQFRNSLSPIVILPPALVVPQLIISGNANLGEISFGSPVSATYSASGGTPPYTWSAVQLPSGLTFSNGSLQGTPTAPGPYSLYIQLLDSAKAIFTLNVSYSVFGITTPALPPATAWSAYSTPFAFAGGTAPYSVSATGLPRGLTATSTGIAGTTTQVGTFPLKVTATDSLGISTCASLTLTVVAEAPLTVTPLTLPPGTVGVPYSQTAAASGGAPAYTWNYVVGAMPPGLTFTTLGTLRGTPTAPGTYTFTARVSDQSGAAMNTSICVTIAPRTLTFLTPSPLSQGIVGVSYPPQVLAVSGGAAPWSFTVASGALPDGLALDPLGNITGTPAAAGTSSFTVAAADSTGVKTSSAYQIAVRSPGPDLMVSPGSLSFSLATGQTFLPVSQSVQVQSSVVATILPYSISITPSVPWLSVNPAAGNTPGAFTVSLTNSALSLSASGGTPFQTTIVVACGPTSLCSGKSQTIPVTLTISPIPAQLTAVPTLTSLVTPASSPQPQSGLITLQNTGGPTLGIASITADAPWVSIGTYPGSVASGGSAAVSFTANPTGLAPGYYQSNVMIESSAGSSSLSVSLFIATGPAFALQPAGRQFQIAAGGSAGPPANTFFVESSSSTPLNWTASIASTSPWLSISPSSGTSTLTQPGIITYTIDPTLAAALAPGAYYARIEVSSPAPVNSPLDFEVVLNVTASTVAQAPAPNPQGLLFIANANSSAPAQTVNVYADSPAPVAFQASPSTLDGNTWLSVSPATGSAAPTSPASTLVSVNTAGLAPGVYYGGVSYAFASAGVRTVNVTLLVEGAGSPATPANTLSPRANPGCTPSQLVLAETGLVSNFSSPAAWPTPIALQVLDDCANTITDAQVVTTFSNGDPPLVLTLANISSGLYEGTWTPRKSSSELTINASANAAGFPAATYQVHGSVTPNNAPILNAGGTLNAFLTQAGGLAPGTIIQVYGSYLASQTGQAASIPLPQSLSNTSLLIGGIEAPLYYSSAGQINAQLPFELQTGHQYQVITNANNALSTPQTIQLTPASPGVAAFPAGTLIAQHTDATLVTETSPARPGEILVLYAAGFGATNTPVPTGAASPANPLAEPVYSPSITINSESATILFAGLTPSLVGLYQIDFQVPSDAPNGDLPLVISQAGVSANSTVLPVHH